MPEPELHVLVTNSKDELGEIVPGTIEGHCQRCGKPVCLAPTSQKFLKEHPDSEISCFGCLTAVERAAFAVGKAKVELMKGQAAEILKYRAHKRRN